MPHIRVPTEALILSGLCLFPALPAWADGSTINLAPGADVNTLTSSLRPGDTVIFADGTYELTAKLNWTGAGTQDAPITIKAAAGATPVLIINKSEHVAYVHDTSYMTIEGLTFKGSDDPLLNNYYGIVVERAQNVSIQNVEVYGKRGHGIYIIESNDLTVERSHVHDLGDGHHGIYVDGSASRFSTRLNFHNNWIHNLIGTNSSGIYLSTFVSESSMTDNVIHAVETNGIYLNQETGGLPNTLARNVIFAIGSAGIQANGSAVVVNNIVFNSVWGIYSYPTSTDTDYSLVVAHNTVTSTTGRAAYFRYVATEAPLAYVLANNSLCSPLAYSFKSENLTEETAGFVRIENNVACGLIETYEGLMTGFSAGAGLSDFSDAVSWDFWPTSDSLLVDSGTIDPSLLPTDDFNGLERDPDAPDVGAYERVTNTNPGWIIAENFKETEVEVAPPPEDTTTESGCGGCSSAPGGHPTPSEGGVILLGLLGLRRKRTRFSPKPPRSE